MAVFKVEEFLQLALRLANSEPNEAGYRTAINRAYYACHLTGRESTVRKGWFKPKYKVPDHSGLVDALKRHTPWGHKLRTLYELRERADYRIGSGDSIDQTDWTTARDIAQDVLPRLQRL